jgi:signal transduction histidine kinase
MLKISSRIVFIVFLLLFTLSQQLISQDKVKNIVVFFSFSANLPAYQNILDGIKSTISVNPEEPGNLIVEYLDIGRSDNDDYVRYIINLYNKKYAETKIDLLIIIGPGINLVLEKYDFKPMKTTPVISLEMDIPGRRSLKNFLNNDFLEIILNLNVSKSLKTAFELFPDYKNVYVVSGNSNTDLYFTSLVAASKKEFVPDHNFFFISGISIDSTIQAVKKIPVNSIVIVPSYLSDNKNTPFSTPEALNIITYNSRAPVFPITDSFIKKEGSIGGYIFSYINLGKEIGRIANERLNGKYLKDITVNEESFYQNIYDWKQLKKWRLLDSKAIPRESIFYNEEISFFTRYEWYILGLLIFFVSQTILILYLIRLNRRQKVITKHMLETENMHRELIREDRLAKMTELTASLSHELNQPLSAILYSAQAGKRFLQTGKLDSKQANEIFDNIIEDDKRAGSIISSVKSLMKLEDREMENVNLNLLLQETIDIINSEAIRNRIKIKLKLDTGPVYVFGDKIQLQQVVMNFIRNASNAIENSNAENKVIEVIMLLSKNSVTVSIRDFGPGIDEAIKGNLFKPFFTTTKKGFGIGLALSRSIIEKHKGVIWAENLPGGGAQFSFMLQPSDSGHLTD